MLLVLLVLLSTYIFAVDGSRSTRPRWMRSRLFMRIAIILVLLGWVKVGASYNERDPCPRGTYRSSASNYRSCMPCPRGRYGSSTGLTTPDCSAPCPTGKYSDIIGGKSENDCKWCPANTYGVQPGLTSSACSGSCPTGKYSLQTGLVSPASCIVCQSLYFEHPACFPKNVARSPPTRNQHRVFGDFTETIVPIVLKSN